MELPLIAKTLVVWARLTTLDQSRGSALTLDDGHSAFDGIVYSELAERRWMAGSDAFRRTQREQAAWPQETAGPNQAVCVAITYTAERIAIYHNGTVQADYPVAKPQAFGADSKVVFGLRHLTAGDRDRCLTGEILEARIYAEALSPEQIAALRPGAAVVPAPWAWWVFADGEVRDRCGRFGESLLLGDTAVRNGALHLPGGTSYAVAAPAGTFSRSLTTTTGNQPGDVSPARRLRDRLLADPQRPRYHFVTPEGYCMPFDPNGAIFWQGQYHLGYIFQDERGHCWGHASSADLLHWRQHPPMLVPNPGDVDRGIFSGNAFVDRAGRAVALYHGVGAGNCIATSTDADLATWHKLPSNPIVPIPKPGEPGHGVYESWDPHGWFENDTYYAVFGGHKPTIFRGKELDQWEYVGPVLDHDLPGVDADEDISCPDLFRLGDKHILLCISHRRGCRYYLGHFDGTQFHAESHHRMNWPGGTCFAPETLLDGQGRRIFWAWVLDRRPPDVAQASGWSGVMTLPRVLGLDETGTMTIQPPEELAALRYAGQERLDFVLDTDLLPCPEMTGDCLELALTANMQTAQRISLEVRRSPNGEETTVITYDAARGVLAVDVSRSSLDPRIVYQTFCMRADNDNPRVTVQEAPFRLREGEPLRLRVFLDASILEVFANDRQCVTQRIYPTRADSLGVALRTTGGTARVVSLESWKLRPTMPW